MNTLNTICWRCCLPIALQRVYRLSILMVIFGLFASNISAQTVANIDIQLSTENEFYIADYQQGDAPQLGVAVSRDSYIYVFSIDTDLRYAQVLPNSFEPNNYVFAIQGAGYPSYQGSYSFSLEGMQGFTTLFAIASPRAISEARLERYVKKYLLFAEAYSDPTKLSNVVIGPGIGADISYLRVSGNQAVQSTNNVVPLNPAYYQLDYALEAAIMPDIQNASGYDSAQYGEEYATGAYTTPEYQEVLDSYQASLNIYNTYADDIPNLNAEITSSVQANNATSANTVPDTITDTVKNENYVFRQTITLNGVEPESAAIQAQPAATASHSATTTFANAVTTESVVQPVLEQPSQVTIQPIQSTNQTVSNAANSAANSAAALTSQIVLTSPVAASTVTPLSVVEQSLQSAVNTSPFKNWAALNLKDYRFVFQQYCYCSDEYLYEMIVSIKNGEVSRVQYLENNQDVPTHVFDSVPSIEDLFMGIAEIRVKGLTTVNVVYNQDYSFPNTAYFVNSPETEIDDVSYTISYFEVQ